MYSHQMMKVPRTGVKGKVDKEKGKVDRAWVAALTGHTADIAEHLSVAWAQV